MTKKFDQIMDNMMTMIMMIMQMQMEKRKHISFMVIMSKIFYLIISFLLSESKLDVLFKSYAIFKQLVYDIRIILSFILV